MLSRIAPFGVSQDAAIFLRHALELAVARKRAAPDRGPDPVHLGLLSAALKLFSASQDSLCFEAERLGLVRLLALAAELLEHARRDVRWTRLHLEGDPKWELEDLRRRARYPLEREASGAARRYGKAV
jgi:hypothetical protein